MYRAHAAHQGTRSASQPQEGYRQGATDSLLRDSGATFIADPHGQQQYAPYAQPAYAQPPPQQPQFTPAQYGASAAPYGNAYAAPPSQVQQQSYAPQPLQIQQHGAYDQGYSQPAPQPSYEYPKGYSGGGGSNDNGGYDSGGSSGAFTPPAGSGPEEQADWSDRLHQQPKAAPARSSGYAQMFLEEQKKKALGGRPRGSDGGAVKAGRRASAKAKPRGAVPEWDSGFTEGPGWMAEAGERRAPQPVLAPPSARPPLTSLRPLFAVYRG